jgi:hypothetical protein
MASAEWRICEQTVSTTRIDNPQSSTTAEALAHRGDLSRDDAVAFRLSTEGARAMNADLPELREHIRARRAALAGFMEQGADLALEGNSLRVIPRKDIYIRYLNDNRATIGELASEFYGRKLRVEVSLNGAGAATAATTDAAGRGGNAAESAAPRVSPSANGAPPEPEPQRQNRAEWRRQLRADAAMMKLALDRIHPPNSGHVYEIRAVHVGGRDGHTVSGVFKSSENALAAELAAKLAAREDVPGVYVLLNPAKPELYARAPRQFVDWAKTTTSDTAVERLTWILIDFDAQLEAGVSSTDVEHQAALTRANKCSDLLMSAGFDRRSIILADSSNGAHCLVACDLPNTTKPKARSDPSKELVTRFLSAIGAELDDDSVTVDMKCTNSARITKLYGSPSRKGFDIEERPHRLSRLVYAPDQIVPAARELIEEIANRAPQEPPREQARRYTGAEKLDLDEWLARVGLADKVGRAKPWNGGTLYEFRGFCPFSDAHTSGAWVARYPSGALAAGCQHNTCAGREWKDLREIYEPETKRQRDQADWTYHGNGNGAGAQENNSGVLASDVQAEWMHWLRPGYFPGGKLAEIIGDPGQGKSLTAIDLMARFTTGRLFPDGAETRKPGTVIFISAEDDLEDTLRPRFEAAGADLSRVRLIAISKRHHLKLPTYPSDLRELRSQIIADRACAVFLDTLDAFLGGSGKIDANVNSSIRKVLTPLAQIAAETGALIAYLRHLNKNPSLGKAMYRGGGSMGITGAARASFLVGSRDDDPDRHTFACVKINGAPKPPALAYRIVECRLPSGIVTQKIEWLGTVAQTADDLVCEPERGPRGPQPHKLEAAKKLLGELLGDGQEHGSDEVEDMAKQWNVSIRTVRDAATQLGVRRRKHGFTGGWRWSIDSAASQEDSLYSAASTNPNAEKDSTERAILRPLGQEDEEAECPPAGQNGPADGGKEF